MAGDTDESELGVSTISEPVLYSIVRKTNVTQATHENGAEKDYQIDRDRMNRYLYKRPWRQRSC